jgi:hypothetical protein
MQTEFVVIIIVLLIFIILGIVLSFTIFNTKATTPTPTPKPETVSTPSKYWLENSRGYANVDMWPPCYDISPPAKKVYSLMVANGSADRYKLLFDVISMMCCQQQELNKADCSRLNIRLNQLLSLGADTKNTRANLTAAGYTTLQNNNNSNFIIAAISLIENQLDNINNDNSITKIDKESIRGFIYVFYQTHLESINKKICKQ